METTDQDKPIPRKPKQVTYAFYLLLGSSTISLLLFVANAILFWQEYYSSQPVYAIFWGLMYVIPFWIAFKINAGRNWARLIFTIFTIISLFSIPEQITSFSDFPVQATLSLISFGLVIVAMFLLFQSSSSAWFKYQAANETPYDPFITEKSKLNDVNSMPA